MIRRLLPLLALFAVQPLQAEFQAGAAVIDNTPTKLPVLVNGGMLSRYLDKIHTRVNARAIVATDGKESVAIVVVDSCMMGRELLEEAKRAFERPAAPNEALHSIKSLPCLAIQPGAARLHESIGLE